MPFSNSPCSKDDSLVVDDLSSLGTLRRPLKKRGQHPLGGNYMGISKNQGPQYRPLIQFSPSYGDS